MMMFAIDEINNSNTLLPNISLGYQIFDSCASPTRTLQATLTLLGGQKKEEEAPQACYPPLSAVIAESGSSQSIAVAGLLGPFHVPMVKLHLCKHRLPELFNVDC